MNTRRSVALGLLTLLCSGCVSQYKVVVDFSPDLEPYFKEIPTIEVDIAAVTEDELSQIKQAGVEKYFAPNNIFRNQLQSQTCFFSNEDDFNFVLPSRAPVWRSWLNKTPANVLVIASLPHDPSMSPQADPRYLFVKMKKSFVMARNIYVFVEPQRVIQIQRPVSSPAAAKKKPEESSGQWVEVEGRIKKRNAK